MDKKKNPLNPILMIDDDQNILDTYQSYLKYNGMDNFLLCRDSREALNLLKTNKVSIIILDLFMPHKTGEELLPEFVREYPEIPVIVITGSNKIETAVSCMKNGSFDYMVKPIEECRFLSGIKRGIEMQNLTRENKRLQSHVLGYELNNPECFAHIITRNDLMFSIFGYIEAIALSPKPVLITGESGVGKELIAQSIHNLSFQTGLRNDNFVSVNVAGLDDTLFSDTLFGHEKGAFTGANTNRSGLIEKAKSGTLFLDEIGDLELSSQIKLLRLLQEMEYYPLGSDVAMISDARVITASNMDLNLKQAEGEFRKDLYYRLNIHNIHIPPLRERPEDIPLLLEFFVKEACQTLKKPQIRITDEIANILKSYSFPGNIRELQSMVFDIVGRTNSPSLDRQLFINYFNSQGKGVNSGRVEKPRTCRISYSGDFPTMEIIENYFIGEAMCKADMNQTAAAQLLGISQSTLSRRFKRRGGPE